MFDVFLCASNYFMDIGIRAVPRRPVQVEVVFLLQMYTFTRYDDIILMSLRSTHVGMVRLREKERKQ